MFKQWQHAEPRNVFQRAFYSFCALRAEPPKVSEHYFARGTEIGMDSRVSKQEISREPVHWTRAARNEEIEKERRALRELIEKFRREPQRDDGSFYRNVGRFIVRRMMKPY
jgi:hypothetical protein